MNYELALNSWNEDEIQAGQNVLRQGATTMSEAVRRRKEEFAVFTGSMRCVIANSGAGGRERLCA
ncbi:MAG: hypothetical protein LBC53_09900 [Spirochaetaceae bacterium]|nr:hypothetical protein [Spirochaetaceae bacterium]